MTWKKIDFNDPETSPPYGREFDIWVVTKSGGARIADIHYERSMGKYVLAGRNNILSPEMKVTHWIEKPEPPQETTHDNADDKPELLRAPTNVAPSVPAESKEGEDGEVAGAGYF